MGVCVCVCVCVCVSVCVCVCVLIYRILFTQNIYIHVGRVCQNQNICHNKFGKLKIDFAECNVLIAKLVFVTSRIFKFKFKFGINLFR